MIYYGAKELAESFKTVRKNTILVAGDIPQDKYSFQPTPDTRSVEKLLTHIALGYGFQHQIHAIQKTSTLVGFDFPALFQQMMVEENKPRTKEEVISLLTTEGEIWSRFLEGLSEDFLGQPVTMPQGAMPASKSRLEMILSVKEHEMHHRGQVMLIQRMLGVVPHLTRDRMAQAAAAHK